MLLSSDDDWPAVEPNLWRARGKWGRLVKILGREGADSIKAGKLYMVVVQEVIIFESETWVMILWLEKSLEGFHHWAVRRMAGMGPKLQWGGTWVYSLIGAVLEMVVLQEIGVYISRLQNMVA